MVDFVRSRRVESRREMMKIRRIICRLVGGGMIWLLAKMSRNRNAGFHRTRRQLDHRRFMPRQAAYRTDVSKFKAHLISPRLFSQSRPYQQFIAIYAIYFIISYLPLRMQPLISRCNTNDDSHALLLLASNGFHLLMPGIISSHISHLLRHDAICALSPKIRRCRMHWDIFTSVLSAIYFISAI